MVESAQCRITVPPVSVDTPRPIWSVMIPTFNCARYLGETLKSVLAQDPGPEQMHIEVVDDHSTEDDPEAVVIEVGKGRVEFHCQPTNVGHVRNFETCLLRSRGHLIHQLHGDDIVREGFYKKMQAAFEQHSDIGMAYCRQIHCDENGHWLRFSPLEMRDSGILSDAVERFILHINIQTPSVAVRRSVYENLRGFDRRLSWTEDWEMWVRIAAKYPVWYETEPLAVYRIHAESSSGRKIKTGENVRDVRNALQIMKSEVDPELYHAVGTRALRNRVRYAMSTARDCLARGDRAAALAQIRESVKMDRSVRTVWQAVCVLVWFGLRAAQWKLGRR